MRSYIVAVLCGAFLFVLPIIGASAQPLSDDVVHARASALLDQMTVAEKAGQLNQLFLNLTDKDADDGVRAGRFGSFLYPPGVDRINHLQHLAVEESRLHIPLLFGVDVINGYRTIFPAPLAMAASWDPAMVENARAIAAREARAAGITWTFAPMVDIARDPRWGRIIEGAGEDPFLGAAMAAAQVRGFQGPYLGAPDHILATVKHFAAYGAAIGGRDYEEASVPESDLWNIYFPPFQAAIAAGVGSVMSAYLDLNDVPATGNRWLLHDVLRDAFGFRGFVVSDAYAVQTLVDHGYAKDAHDAALRAINAGVAIDMDGRIYPNQIPHLIEAHELSVAQLDALVRPFLETKIRLGLFEHPYTDPTALDRVLKDPAHRTAARVAAERSAVLLKNEKDILPLKASALKKIAVIGPLADSQQDTLGTWTMNANRSETVTLLAGLRAHVPASVSVTYAQGVQFGRKYESEFDQFYRVPAQDAWTAPQAATEFAHAVDLAATSDLTIMVVGEAYNMSGEDASQTSLDLPGDQQKLLEAVVATGKPVVLLVMNGRPVNLTWAAAHVPAILEVWHPGTEGGTAVANLLFGDATPGGKLPITWPRSVRQIPIYYDHNLTMRPEAADRRTWDEESVPLYPFGFGLSYAHFRYDNLRIAQPSMRPGEKIDVAVDVENTSDRRGDEVVQLYIHQRAGSASRPVRELKGFQRITLDAHARTTVKLSVPADALRYWSSADRAFVQDAADFDLWVGTDFTATLHGTFAVRR